MNLWRWAAGEVTVRITSADVSGFLEYLNRWGISMYGFSWEDELTLSFRVCVRDGKRVLKLAEKRGVRAEIRAREGLYWTLKALGKRPILLLGTVALLLLTLYLPTRVLFVQVEGNSTVPSGQILAAADNCGIRFGISRREVRSEKVKNALIGELPQLEWAGVNTSGCIATITVRERSAPLRQQQTESGISSIVAARDGVILSCTAEAGSVQCQVGQAVREGEVLISGYTDCGIVIQATRAEGEVFALTRHRIQAIAPSERIRKGQILEQRKKYSIIIGKKRINFYNGSGICDTSCGRMYAEYYIYLPGGFQLPLALAVETISYPDTYPTECDPDTAEEDLSSFLRNYASSRMISGEILRMMEGFSCADGVYRLEGDYLCREMIGRNRQEGKVETDGKSG